MLARILPIFALIVLGVLGYWLYSQGTIQQILRPTVLAAETKRSVIAGQKIRESFVTMKEVPLTRVEPGMLTFPEGTTAKGVEEALGDKTMSTTIQKGRFLRSSMLGESAAFIVLRARDNIAEGEALSLQNVSASELGSAPEAGAIVFNSEEEATLYVSKAYDLTARKAIYSSQILTIDDTAGGAENLFVVRTSRDFSRGNRLSINGLELAEIQSGNLPSGAIAFRTRGAADVFITSAGKYVLAESVDAGETVVADMISAAQGDSDMAPGDLPRTLGELTSYMRAYPDRAMFMDRTKFYGSRGVREGERVDIWVETSRSAGAFGQIRLERLDGAVVVRRAVDDSRPEDAAAREDAATPEGQADIGEIEAGEEVDTLRQYLWVAMDPAVMDRFRAAREEGRIAFAANGSDNIVDLLGNGASCLDEVCHISRSTSDDLAELAGAMAPVASETGPDGAPLAAPLAVMDGVGSDLETRLRENGYDTFELIAAWSDAEMPAISIKLDISPNLAAYIRQQARILSDSAATAARDLGFDEIPQE